MGETNAPGGGEGQKPPVATPDSVASAPAGPAPGPAPAGASQPIININIPAQQPPQQVIVQGPQPNRHLRRTLSVSSSVAAGVAALAIVGAGVGIFGGATPNWSGPPVPPPTTAPVTNPTPPPPLSHIPPKIEVSGAYVDEAHPGDQQWVNVSMTITNQGMKPVQRAQIEFVQKDPRTGVETPLEIYQIQGDGNWYSIPNGVQEDLLGGSPEFVTFTINNWQPGLPISIKVFGNGVANDVSEQYVACPTPGDGQFRCNLPGE